MIFEVIQSYLTLEEYDKFIKLLYLYDNNILSYIEFIKLTENFLVKLDKSICLTLKSLIETREQKRNQKNKFNIKNNLG